MNEVFKVALHYEKKLYLIKVYSWTVPEISQLIAGVYKRLKQYTDENN